MTATEARTDYRLDDRYTAEHGTVFLSGVQALARLPLDQLRADRRRGLDTAAFISGYPGSPLGGFDKAMATTRALVPDLPIVHQPGLNEEYAATAVMGAQLASARDNARHDGVVGLWYGKAPGIERATDALRHAVFAGTSMHGGAVALVGDDPNAKSSSVPSSSAGIAADLHMPLLYPGDPGDALDLGRHAIALSRCTGLWTALKIVADVADGTTSIVLDPDRVHPMMPLVDGERYLHRPDGHVLAAQSVVVEREIYEVRYPLATRYAAENELNHIAVDAPDAWIGVVSSGITYRELREAFARLGLVSDADIAACGVRLIRMQMPLPFDPERMRSFTADLDEVIVAEEKNPHIESLIKDALYGLTNRPTVVGKFDDHGSPLLPGWGSLTAALIEPALRRRLQGRLGARLAPAAPRRRESIPLSVERSPFYCSGCPHNRSTQVPDGAVVGAGVGCHTMALMMEPERVGDIVGLTAMGNEGTQWIGMAPFVETEHLFQNLGDGTYFHSGQLAIGAAVAAGVNITYKLLHNGTVAMTGGQDPNGQVGLGAIAQTLLAKGVGRVLITSDDPDRTRGDADLPSAVDVWPRERLIEAQELLAATPGVTVLVHDQACAAEARRGRKRGLIETPDQRVVINERVCEGCGDCGTVSNCLSVQPVDTPFGRKTRIDQTSCNLDFSCLEGDCPSFMTVHQEPGRVGRLLRRLRAAPVADDESTDIGTDTPTPPGEPVGLADPLPAKVDVDSFALRLTGVGGTGVVTVAQIIGTAAMLAGYDVQGLDQIGLSQKAGPVVSDLRLARGPVLHSNRLGEGQADALLVFDPLVGASELGLASVAATSVVVGSTAFAPTGEMIIHPDITPPDSDELTDRLAQRSRADAQYWADAQAITTAVLGDTQTANLFVVGMAVQAGALPLPLEALSEAITLNGVAVTANLAALALGRRYVAEPGAFADLVDPAEVAPAASPFDRRVGTLPVSPELRAQVTRLADELVAFQDSRLAERYLDVVERVAASERATVATESLTAAVAANLFKLMAYKDEYEVARLLFDEQGQAAARELAGPRGRVAMKLHPPLLRAIGVSKKMSFGPRTQPLLRHLAKGKRLRGSRLDPFGRSEIRRLERELPAEYIAAVEQVLTTLSVANHDDAVAIAGLPDQVRGYEELKLERIRAYRAEINDALADFDRPGPTAAPTIGIVEMAGGPR